MELCLSRKNSWIYLYCNRILGNQLLLISRYQLYAPWVLDTDTNTHILHCSWVLNPLGQRPRFLVFCWKTFVFTLKKLSIVVFSPTIYFGPFWSWFLYIQIFTFFINYCMYCTSGIIHMFGSITFIYVCINKHLYVFLFSESKGRKRELSGGVYPSTMALLSLCMLYLRTPG